MSTNYFALIICLSIAFLSCSKTPPQKQMSVDEHVMIYQELLSMEYALLTKKHKQAIVHANSLDELLKNNYNLYCPNESDQIDGARMTNHILKENIANANTKDLLDDLRVLKATIINLETDDDYDPYFAFLWRFEEEMFAATKVAIDPMLDLYEWNEFEDMVYCMNQSWEPVRLHFPSPKFLDYDTAKYKNQTVYKIYLENALEQFNKSVNSDDYEKYPICESAEAVRSAYLDYIKTFIQSSIGSDLMLAKI